MSAMDAFDELAHYYDAIMEHVDYERWAKIAEELGRLAPAPVRHLDAACGTGVLLERLGHTRWKRCGFDLSHAMLRQTRKQGRFLSVVNADLRDLPFGPCFSLITCLFDSINFLLDERDMRRAFQQMAGALAPGGLVYVDTVTEHMVTKHFAGKTWTENSGAFDTTWSNTYDRQAKVHHAQVRVSNGDGGLIRERVYPTETLLEALEEAGLVVLGVFDTVGWQPVRPRTTRIEFVAAKTPPKRLVQQFQHSVAKIRMGNL